MARRWTRLSLGRDYPHAELATLGVPFVAISGVAVTAATLGVWLQRVACIEEWVIKMTLCLVALSRRVEAAYPLLRPLWKSGQVRGLLDAGILVEYLS